MSKWNRLFCLSESSLNRKLARK